MPLAVLGGTFDPPHIGHLVLGECARVQFGAERVLFVPAGDPYRKTAAHVASSGAFRPGRRDVTPAALRLEMMRLAVEGNAAFEADGREVRRAGPTYTVDTLEELIAEGHDDIVLILGSDAIADMAHWREPGRIARLARIVAAEKASDRGRIAAIADHAGLPYTPEVVDMPELVISGTEIRARVAAGKPVRYLVPDAVAAFIAANGLYR